MAHFEFEGCVTNVHRSCLCINIARYLWHSFHVGDHIPLYLVYIGQCLAVTNEYISPILLFSHTNIVSKSYLRFSPILVIDWQSYSHPHKSLLVVKPPHPDLPQDGNADSLNLIIIVTDFDWVGAITNSSSSSPTVICRWCQPLETRRSCVHRSFEHYQFHQEVEGPRHLCAISTLPLTDCMNGRKVCACTMSSLPPLLLLQLMTGEEGLRLPVPPSPTALGSLGGK